MKKYMPIVFIFLIIALFGCTPTKQNNQHIGTWEADIGEDYTLIWEIDDIKLIYTMDERCQTNEYTVDYSKNPIWFDCRFSDTDAHCIMKFINDDTFMIVGSEGEEPRPQHFEGAEDLLTFNRLKQ